MPKDIYTSRKRRSWQMIQSTIYDLFIIAFTSFNSNYSPHYFRSLRLFPFAVEKRYLFRKNATTHKARPTSHLLLEYHKFLTLRKNVLQYLLEKARQSGLINSSLQAHITLSLTQEECMALDVLQIKDHRINF
ncbi:hypothetical protein ACEW7V_02660 [Areca yellow leaf disease phytoplasma]|uniref:hypothetical protein n=1 Tax=Areca yellow leaf disease phytoplasma TaxID=927614 RepID=UPI0035B50314